jgi:hypothetical protein
MQQEIERVVRLTNDKAELITEQTGRELSLSADESKQYLFEVLKEVKAQSGST